MKILCLLISLLLVTTSLVMGFHVHRLMPMRCLMISAVKKDGTYSLTHSPTHSLTHSPTHSLTHSPTHSPIKMRSKANSMLFVGIILLLVPYLATSYIFSRVKSTRIAMERSMFQGIYYSLTHSLTHSLTRCF
jgi:hypothetical protein